MRLCPFMAQSPPTVPRNTEKTAAEFADSAALSAENTEDFRNMYGATRSRSAAHGGKVPAPPSYS